MSKKRWQRWLRMIWALVLVGVALYGGVVAMVFFFQDRLIYLPPGTPLVGTPADHSMLYEDVWLDTEDGERLHGWFVHTGPERSSRGVVLFFHGNGCNVSDHLSSLVLFHRLGLDTLIIDYRGYGQSSGRPDEQGTYRDAAAAWHELTRARGIPPGHIIVAGRSLGGAVAAWVAQTYQPGALVLEATFTSLPDAAAEIYPLLPVRVLARYRYNTLARMADITAPVLVIHSRDDRLVPFSHGQRLFAAANQPAEFLELQGGHNSAFTLSEEHYRAGLDGFLTRVMP